MQRNDVSARIILPIILIVIGAIIIWRHWNPGKLDPTMLAGVSIVLVGVYGVWLECTVLRDVDTK